MQDYRTRFPLDTQEADASVAAAGEYRAMLDRLESDDLPRFESAVQGTAQREHHPRGRRTSNRSSIASARRSASGSRPSTARCADIDYNPGRYIVLEADAEHRRGDPRLPAGPARLHRRHADRLGRRHIFRGEVPAGQAHHRALSRPRGHGRTRSPLDRESHRRAHTGSPSPPPSAGGKTTANTSTTPIPAANPADRRRSSRTPCWPRAWPISSAWSGRAAQRPLVPLRGHRRGLRPRLRRIRALWPGAFRSS